MLRYDGEMMFDKPLSHKEKAFLNKWQEGLKKIYEIEGVYGAGCPQKLSALSGITLDVDQARLIMQSMSPMISFEHDRLIISGQAPKGNLRQALLAYRHFFLNEGGVLTTVMSLDFMKPHSFDGIVECEKNDWKKASHSRWCYVVKGESIFSVDTASKHAYLNNPHRWPAQEKADDFQEKLNKYFNHLVSYAHLKTSLEVFPNKSRGRRLKV